MSTGNLSACTNNCYFSTDNIIYLLPWRQDIACVMHMCWHGQGLLIKGEVYGDMKITVRQENMSIWCFLIASSWVIQMTLSHLNITGYNGGMKYVLYAIDIQAKYQRQ